MNLLFLPAYFKPEEIASSRFIESLHEELFRQGFSMEVHAPIPTRGVSPVLRKEYKNKKKEILYEGKLIVHRFPLMREKKNLVLRTFRYLCGFFIQRRRGRQAKDVDLIFVASTPPIQGAMAAQVKKRLKVPFVYGLQDIFPDSLVGTGMTKKGSLLWKIGRKIEDYTYKNADKIIVISEDFKRNIMAKGVPEEKIEVIYNWVDENAVVPIIPEENALFDEFNLDRGDFHVVYAGNLGHAQNLQIILEVAQQLKEYSDLKFIIFGTGGVKEELEQEINKHSLSNVLMFPLQPKEKISQVYSLGEASIVSCKPGLGGSAFPSKTWSIMSAGTAVLANFDEGTELQHIIEKNEVGLFTKAGDVTQLKEAVLQLYNSREKCKKYGVKAREFILNNLTKEIGTSKYIEVFNNTIKNSKI